MAKDLNQCNFIGRLGKDPEFRTIPDGTLTAKFSLAVGDDYKNKQGEKVEQTNWIPVVAFGKQAEIIEKYVHKGSRLFVSGKFTVRKWQEQNGQDRYSTEIRLNEMQMLDNKADGQQAPAQGKQKPHSPDMNNPKTYADFDDEIPF